ncbi:Ribbon-helix-helix protein, copG family [Paramicrobacterium humi]|uniref:Ribbon-helix-helix protein, copG family n=1 Tax=Paramicrobacterium humi TaxID=640635 RepID=A0A1H4NHF9_9MICO|nr:ribbon-helix-helix domain-containing protein [Microbacterium humi]SEB94318.1 Ribbon-helix-helix protein, copG family [Microbacterium humi]
MMQGSGIDFDGLWLARNIRITIIGMERRMGGREVSEAEVDQWVEEAEAGYAPETLKTRMGRPARGAEASRVIPVRLTDEELEAIMARAKRENLNRSEAIRAALKSWAHAA